MSCNCIGNSEFPENISEETKAKTQTHPCYSAGAHDNARMHIPVAPMCNISCNYCNRKFDCLHESRPGVTSEVLTPQEALEKFEVVSEKIDNLKVVGIAGPGDALANWESTKKSIELIREKDPTVTFCLSTNGLMLPEYADEIVKLGVHHVTVTINTIDPEIGAKIYAHVLYKGTRYTGVEGAKILLENQLKGLEMLTKQGVMCKVNIVMVKGVNEDTIPDVVKIVKELGAFMTNIMPLIPAEGTVFQNMKLVSNVELTAMRKKCSIDLKQMYHCKQCRADAIGKLEQDRSYEFRNVIKDIKLEKTAKKIKVAVASKTGDLIDLHFGHAKNFLVYQYDSGKVEFLEKRDIENYCSGKEECGIEEDKIDKIDKIIDAIKDCGLVLSMRIGEEPKRKLLKNNIETVEMYDSIENGILSAVEGLAE